MHVLDRDDLLLFVEPRTPAVKSPVVDELTRRVAYALSTSEGGILVKGRIIPGRYRGTHTCECGARSSNQDYLTKTGLITNSLAPHYVAYHRNSLVSSEIAKANALPAAPYTYAIKFNELAYPLHTR